MERELYSKCMICHDEEYLGKVYDDELPKSINRLTTHRLCSEECLNKYLFLYGLSQSEIPKDDDG